MEREVNGIRMHYEEAGSGPALVFIHGFPLTHEMWSAQVAGLSRRARAIAPDLRGFGGTDLREPVSMSRYADDVRALVEALGERAAVICGHSMGGYVALRFIDRYPEVARGLILVDSRAEADTPEARQRRMATVERVQGEGSAGFLAEFAANLVGPTTKERRPEVAERVRAIAARAGRDAVAAALRALADRPDSTRLLASIRVPALIVHGEEDTVIPMQAAEALHAGVSGSELVRVAEAGHTPPAERPEAFNEALDAFLRRLDTQLPAMSP